MLKNIALAIVALISSLFGIKNIPNNLNPLPQITTVVTPSPIVNNDFLEINFEGKEYLIYYAKISGREISLIPNFTQKETSTTIIEKNNCQIAINGGYYTKEEEPLGLFKSANKIYQKEIVDETLLTGFFSVSEKGQIALSGQSLEDDPLILQAGPLIINGNKMKMKVDEETRRIVIAQTIDNAFYALAVIQKDDRYLGPNLADLPPILFSIKNPFQVIKALNLDGGGSSVFFYKGFFLSELQTAGSLICIR